MDIKSRAKEIASAALLTKIIDLTDPDAAKLLQVELSNIENGKPRGIFAKLIILTAALQELEALIKTTNNHSEVMEINMYQVMLLKEIEITARDLSIRLE